MHQLEFAAISEGWLREALNWVIEKECDGARTITVERDYKIRIQWLLKAFGDCPLEVMCGRSGYERLREVWQSERSKPDGMKNVSIKKRFKFLLRALKFAAARDLIDITRIPPMPKMQNDEEPRDLFHTIEQHKLVRAEMPSDWHRMAIDLGFWTGMHTRDLVGTKRHHIDFDFPIKDDSGKRRGRGAWYMRNSKNGTGHWLPLDDEFRACLRDYLESRPLRFDEPLIGDIPRADRWLRPACVRAAVPVITIANCRQSRHKYLEGKGMDVGLLRYQMGHLGVDVNRVTTKYYLGTTPSPSVVVKMAELVSPDAPRKGPKRVVIGAFKKKATNNRK